MYKKITLQQMTRSRRTLRTMYAEMQCNDYVLEFNSGHKICVTKFFGNHPYGLTVYDGKGDAGSVHGFDTPGQAIKHFNDLVQNGGIRNNLIPPELIC